MPFCSQCGNQVHEADRFCGRCGATQPPAAFTAARGTRPPADPLSGMSPRTASILCYIPWVGWIAAIIVLASEKFRHNPTVRFHAFQGLYLFVAWLMNDWVLRFAFIGVPHFPLHALIDLVLLGMWIFMMIKASHEEAYSLPLFGELAQRSAAEH